MCCSVSYRTSFRAIPGQTVDFEYNFVKVCVCVCGTLSFVETACLGEFVQDAATRTQKPEAPPSHTADGEKPQGTMGRLPSPSVNSDVTTSADGGCEVTVSSRHVLLC